MFGRAVASHDDVCVDGVGQIDHHSHGPFIIGKGFGDVLGFPFLPELDFARVPDLVACWNTGLDTSVISLIIVSSQGRGGVWKVPKYDPVILEWPLILDS